MSKNDKYVSSWISKDLVIEMIYDETKSESLLAISDNVNVRIAPVIELDGLRIRPLDATSDLVKKKVILFPSEVGIYESEDSLVKEIQEFIHRYLDVKPLFEKIASYYVLFTWVFDRFGELPYLRALGDYGSGKTRLLQVLGSICYKPIFAGGATTVSPIFRILDAHKGTLVLDEGDFRFSDKTAEIIKILNNGYQRGFPVMRTEGGKNGKFDVKTYEVFSPKIIATRSKYSDKALESRFLVEEMDKKKLRADIPLSLTDKFWNEALMLRNKLLTWRFRKFKTVMESYENIDRTLEPRINQIISPLLSVVSSEDIRGEIKQFVRQYNDEIISDRGMDRDADVLIAILKCFNVGHEDATVKHITDTYNAIVGEKDQESAKKIGWIIRDRLQLKPIKKRGGYTIGKQKNEEKLELLKTKFGITEDDLKDEFEDYDKGEHGEHVNVTGGVKQYSVNADIDPTTLPF